MPPGEPGNIAVYGTDPLHRGSNPPRRAAQRGVHPALEPPKLSVFLRVPAKTRRTLLSWRVRRC